MRVLWIDWNSYGKADILETLKEMGHETVIFPLEAKNYRIDPKYKHELKNAITEKQCDLVFSSNYFPVVSDACKEKKVPYVAWCYDSPMILLYHKSVYNACNFIFVFDSHMYFDLRGKGVETVYYLPLAVNDKRLSLISLTEKDREMFGADVSFIGSMYNEKHTLFDRMEDLDEYTRGYLEAAMEAQRKVYGTWFLEDMLTPDITLNMQNSLRFETSRDGFETPQYVYGNYFLGRKMAERDRHEALQNLSGTEVKLYTHQPTPKLPEIKNMGPVDYETQMPKVFMASKINLNITLRSIVNGIPLRAMDIMGAGGFLLTNYQQDMLEYFTPDVDFVYYENFEDMKEKVKYYLAHEDERLQIAANGCKKVRENHNYRVRLEEIFSLCRRNS